MRIAQPKTEEELDMDRLLPKGTYDFEIVKAEEKTSKKGNDMIDANLKVFHGDGFQFVRDFLMEAMPHKLRHFAETVGILEAYDAGQLVANELVGLSGKVRIDIEPAGEYPAKNVVKDYGEKKKSEASAKGPMMNAGPKQLIEDGPDGTDIPF
jgi:hypothetical protein